MSVTLDNFLRYIAYDTQSKEDQKQQPSTEKQFALAKLLEKELKEMGASHVTLNDQCYLMASIPATTDRKVPVLGFISHRDTAPAFSGSVSYTHLDVYKRQGGGSRLRPVYSG